MITLEKIRTEIVEKQKNTIDWSRSVGLIDALDIIDKYAEQEPMREFTEEEAKAYSKALDKMYKPTGFNVFNEPCDDAQERYEDLCEYFGDAKDILKSRKDFKAWLERIKWHIHKAEELYEKYEYKQEPCDDAISRQYLIDIATKDGAYDYVSAQEIANAPSVRQQEPEIVKYGWTKIPKCTTCKYWYSPIVPCSRCKDNSEFEPQESEDKE